MSVADTFQPWRVHNLGKVGSADDRAESLLPRDPDQISRFGSLKDGLTSVMSSRFKVAPPFSESFRVGWSDVDY